MNEHLKPSPHCIRLRGPWQYKVLSRSIITSDGTVVETTVDLPPEGHMAMPSDWGSTLGADFHGRVQYTRHFGCPTGIEPNDTVHLVLDQIDPMGRVSLNGICLGDVAAGGQPARFIVGSALQKRNVLAVEVEFPRCEPSQASVARPGREGLPGGLIGEVRLEILASTR